MQDLSATIGGAGKAAWDRLNLSNPEILVESAAPEVVLKRYIKPLSDLLFGGGVQQPWITYHFCTRSHPSWAKASQNGTVFGVTLCPTPDESSGRAPTSTWDVFKVEIYVFEPLEKYVPNKRGARLRHYVRVLYHEMTHVYLTSYLCVCATCQTPARYAAFASLGRHGHGLHFQYVSQMGENVLQNVLGFPATTTNTSPRDLQFAQEIFESSWVAGVGYSRAARVEIGDEEMRSLGLDPQAVWAHYWVMVDVWDAKVQKMTLGERAAAIMVMDERREDLVTACRFTVRGDSEDDESL